MRKRDVRTRPRPPKDLNDLVTLEAAGTLTETLWKDLLGDASVPVPLQDLKCGIERLYLKGIAYTLQKKDHPASSIALVALDCIRLDAKKPGLLSRLDMPLGARSRSEMYPYRWVDVLAEALFLSDYWQRCEEPIGGLLASALRMTRDRILKEEAEIAQNKKALGSFAYSGQYQQRPVPITGGVWKKSWFRFYRRADLPERFDMVVASWDCAFKDLKTSDFVTGQLWGRKAADFYLLDQIHGRLDFPATLAAIPTLNLRARYRVNAVLVEDKANGSAVISVLKREIPPSGCQSQRRQRSPRLSSPINRSWQRADPHAGRKSLGR